ncbi:chitinase-like protein Idgf1 [Stomoxys calcitrans]|uniref:chitinase-like protein Idgf1 n=1 Tax=Stomoxys calcitrans TaxID=35570 RepID=UPI0027E291B1|nr:chitinase-like protein Idgf1 [Stomoxys calcitrans]
MSLIKSIVWLSFMLSFLESTASQNANSKRLVCYFNADSLLANGYAKFTMAHLNRAASLCTHLAYDSAFLQPQSFALRLSKAPITTNDIRLQYPHLKLYLTLGGDKDGHEPYIALLASNRSQQLKFIQNCVEEVKRLGFDGLDLAFPLPRNKPSEETSVAMFFKDLAKIWSDKKMDKYKEKYTSLVNEMKEAFDKAKLSLVMTVLPNVNSSLYFDVPKIQHSFEFINLFAFDFNTPERNPSEADYSAPLFMNRKQHRLPYANVDFQVSHWLNNGCPASQLNLGVATYGRAWNMTLESGLSGEPIVEHTLANVGFGKHFLKNGSISWTNICFHLPPQQRHGVSLSQITDEYGNYAFRPANKNGTRGYWISFDDPQFAARKAKYVNDKSLGGVAVFDINRDDFKSICRGTEGFPILQAIRRTLNIEQTPQRRSFATLQKKLANALKFIG